MSSYIPINMYWMQPILKYRVDYAKPNVQYAQIDGGMKKILAK